MLKATSVTKYGLESYPVSLEVNEHGYVLIPEDPDAIEYKLYAPMAGFEEHGPWYLKRIIPKREAVRARHTMSALYETSDLIACLAPRSPWIELPPPLEGQEYWRIDNYVIIECPQIV